MKIIATIPVRNEEWCLSLTARAALLWADEIVIGLHACTDRSAEIVQQVYVEHPGRVSVLVNDEPTWSEMEHRQNLLEIARHHGATHLAMVDADEVLTGNLLPRIRDLIETHCQPGVILNLPWLALARDPNRVIIGPSYWGERQQVCTAFMDLADYFCSSNLRGGYQFHQRPPMSVHKVKRFVCPVAPSQGGLMHLQFLSERRLRAKQALYKCNEVLRHGDNMLGQRATLQQMDAAYSRAVYESDPKRPGVHTEDTPECWWEPYIGLVPGPLDIEGLDIDAEPWQEIQVKRLVAEHGRERFAGLDLFGL